MACSSVIATGTPRQIPQSERGSVLGGALLLLSGVALTALAGEYVTSGSAQVWLANAGWSASALIAVIGVAAAWRRSSRRDRLAWTLLLGGCVAWLVGQMFWDLYAATSFPASPNPADVCWLAFAVLSAAGVHRFGARVWRTRRVSWLELAPLMVAVCALVTALSWNDIQGSTLSEAASITALAYPVFYVSAVLVMLQSALAGAIDLRRNPGLAALLGGLGLEALAFILWSPLLLDGSYAAGTNVVDGLWGVGMILIGIGARSARPPAPVAEFEQLTRRRGGILPALTFVALQIVLLTRQALSGAELSLSIGVAVVGGTLIARTTILRRQQDALYAQLDQRGRELQDANGRLSEESRRDPLTGLGNRLRLREDLADLAARAERYQHGYCLVLIDLDRFKAYNDEHGHQAGDSALRRVAAQLTAHARDGDRVYRYGGEELLLILPEQVLHAAQATAERHRLDLEQVAIPHPRNPPTNILTFSAGIAAAQPGETPQRVLKRADEALYTAKNTGRNRTVIAESRTNLPATPTSSAAYTKSISA